MFTGLVETMGRVKAISPDDKGGVRLSLEVPSFKEVELGESISVNGVCLTVVAWQNQIADFQLAPETLRKSNLGMLQAGCFVNLERALKMGDRLGGHWVQGHVDGVGVLKHRRADGEWELFEFQCDTDLTRYMVKKGSICLSGVSLTLVDVTTNGFSIALIPHTLSVTTFGQLQTSDKVNIEVDILAKYVEKLLPTP